MTASPFQPFPRLEQYCQWLTSEGGSVEQGDNRWGGFTRLISPDGKSQVVEAGTEPEEVLAPSSLLRLDYRLDLVSPWSPQSVPDDPYSPEAATGSLFES